MRVLRQMELWPPSWPLVLGVLKELLLDRVDGLRPVGRDPILIQQETTQEEEIMLSNKMTIFLDHCGPLLRYENGVLRVEDLNPEIKTRWRLSRAERVMIGLRFIVSAIYK
jgi:hypothetical protein